MSQAEIFTTPCACCGRVGQRVYFDGEEMTCVDLQDCIIACQRLSPPVTSQEALSDAEEF